MDKKLLIDIKVFLKIEVSRMERVCNQTPIASNCEQLDSIKELLTRVTDEITWMPLE